MEKEPSLNADVGALLGQEAIFQSTEPVDAGKIRRFAQALGFDHSLYYDLERGQPTAPLTYVFSVNHDSLGGMDPSGRPANSINLPSSYGPPLRGGNTYQFFRPVRTGDLIRTYRKIKDVNDKKAIMEISYSSPLPSIIPIKMANYWVSIRKSLSFE